MPPVIAIVAAVATIAVTHFVTSLILKVILLVAISIAAKALMPKPKNQRLNQGQELTLKLDPSQARQIIVGRTMTGGSNVFAFTWTDTPSKPNRNLKRIIALSDLPCTALIGVWVGDEKLTFDGDPTTGWRYVEGFRDQDGYRHCSMRIYLGSPSAVADADCISQSGGLWTSAHKGTNMCYAVVNMDYDGDAFPNGEPQFTFELEGVKCYDDRYDSTKPGGSGTQRLATPSTWAYTRNAAVITAQVLRGFKSNGVPLIGISAEERDLSTAMLFSAYNTCDQSVANDTGTQPRYRADMIINSQESVSDILLALQAAMDGAIRDRGGAITILPGAVRSAVLNLTDADICWDQEKSWQPRASLSDLKNHVIASFVDETAGYVEKPLPPRRNAQWEIDDGGERFTDQFALRAVINWSQGQRITKRVHDASRFQGTASFVMPIWYLELEQGDWFTLTSARWNFSTKWFEAVNVDITTDLRIAVVAKEVSTTLDSWVPASDQYARTDTSWSPPAYDPVIPIFTVTPILETSIYTASQSAGVSVSITNMPLGAVAQTIEFELALQADLGTVWNLPTVAAKNQVVKYLELVPGTEYSIRARGVQGQLHSDWSDWEDFTTLSNDTGDGTNMLIDPVSLTKATYTNSAQAQTDLGADGRVADKYSARLSGHTNSRVEWGPMLPVVAGETLWYSFTAKTNVSAAPDYVVGGYDYYGAGGVLIGSHTVDETLTAGDEAIGDWARKDGSFVVPDDTAYVSTWVNRPLWGGTGHFYVAEPYLGRSQPGADITAANTPIQVGPGTQVIRAIYDGTVKEGEFPRILSFMRKKADVNISPAASWTIETVGVTATINNTPGDSDRGQVEVTAMDAPAEGHIIVTSTSNSVPLTTDVLFQKDLAPAPVPPTPSSVSFDVNHGDDNYLYDHAPVGTCSITITSGQDIVCSAPLTTTTDRNPGIVRPLGKWQYSPTGAGTWSDISGEIYGTAPSWSWSTQNAPGYLNVNQTKSGLSAGTYDLRLLVRRDEGDPNPFYYYVGTATVQAVTP